MKQEHSTWVKGSLVLSTPEPTDFETIQHMQGSDIIVITDGAVNNIVFITDAAINKMMGG